MIISYYGFATFLKTPYSQHHWNIQQWLHHQLNILCVEIWDITEDSPIAHTIDVYDNDYMINWPYFCVEAIIKINSNQQPPKVSPQHPNLRHFGRPHIAHTIDTFNNDYIINLTSHCVETIIKINSNQLPWKVWPQHPNLGHFGRPPTGHTIYIYKHRHRRNVTSHHSLSHLSLLYFNFLNFHH